MTTFADLGIPFPLFEAPTDEASEYVGKSTCVLCKSKHYCFRLGVGCAVVLPCPKCGADRYLDCSDRNNEACGLCEAEVNFPTLFREDVEVCYGCLRAGKAVITKDTEFGMVSWGQAVQGITNGVPGLETDEFERVLVDVEDSWYGVRIPKEHLFELLHTPTMISWQGERWLFCCKTPMTYIGEWATVADLRFRGKELDAVFKTLFDQKDQGEWLWDRLSSRKIDQPCLYAYECKKCGRFRSTWDMS